MKRSDVLNLIHDAIREYSSDGEIILTDQIEKDMCESVLRSLEEVGMLPPEYKVLPTEYSLNEWEDES